MTGRHLVDRLHEKLQYALSDATDGGIITIGDIYQRLIPYRSVRGDVGVMELATYEHALLQLLAGERGFVQVEREDAAGELRKELLSPNPILGIYRDYADVRVTVNVPTAKAPVESAGDESAGHETAGPESGLPESVSSESAEPVSAVSGSGESLEARSPAAIPGPPSAAPVTSSAELSTWIVEPAAEPLPVEAAAVERDCSGCGKPLPSISGLRFCPFCGRAPDPLPCVRCGTRLEAVWNFCIRCGSPVAH